MYLSDAIGSSEDGAGGISQGGAAAGDGGVVTTSAIGDSEAVDEDLTGGVTQSPGAGPGASRTVGSPCWHRLQRQGGPNRKRWSRRSRPTPGCTTPWRSAQLTRAGA